MLSRITGFARDVLLTTTFGLKSVTDSFWFAFTIPNLLRRLFAEGAIAAVFVPPFAKMLEGGDPPRAYQLLARALALQTTVLTGVVILIEAILLILWWWAARGGAPEAGERQLVLLLTAIMQPYTIAVCVVALLASILNCVGSFAFPALVSALLNIGMLAGLVFARVLFQTPEKQAVFVAASVVVSGALQVLFLLPPLRAHQIPLRWEWNTQDADVRRMLTSFVPVIFGQGALMLGTFFDNLICWGFRATDQSGPTADWFGWQFQYPLDEGAIATLNVAQRLYQLPLGVGAISLGTAVLPRLARLVGQQNWRAWDQELRDSLRLTLFMGLLSGALLIGMGDTFFRFLFEHGKVGAAGTDRAAPVIASYGWGMWAFCAQHIVLRAFYSCDDVRTPLRLSLVLVPLNSVISFLLIWSPDVREAAFGYASAITSTIGLLVGMHLLQRRSGVPLFGRALGVAVLRMLFAAVASYLAATYTTHAVLTAARDAGAIELVARALETASGIAAGVGVFLIASRLLGLPEARLTLQLFLRRRKNAAVTPPRT